MENLIDNRQIRVFISSTFRDMQDERNYLMKRTFPKLRKLAAERDVTLTELDLRWGITEEESESGKVVEICLREIENSIPFFIGIIGNRYGWIPKKEDLGGNVTERFADVSKFVDQHLSVTEMEMQFGVLSREEDMHAYFYIKEQEEEEPDGNDALLARLKEEVRKSRYPSTTYSSPENLAMQVEEAFMALLDQLFPHGNLSELEKERIGQRAFMNQLCQNYINDDCSFEALDAWLADKDSRQYVVTGASGLGKSALIANWVKEKLNDPECKYNIIYHFTGNGGSESNSQHITKSLINEINDLYGWEDADADSKLSDLFVRLSAEEGKPLLIVIDAINQIVDADNAKLLNWLPIPAKNIKILYSTLEDDRTMEVFRNRNYPVFTLQSLDKGRRSELVNSYLRLYAKSLNEGRVERIVTDTKCENTLVLKTILNELINFGIYEQIDKRIDYLLEACSIDGFYQTILESYEDEYREYDENFTKEILSLIALSRDGLTETEIVSITGIKWYQWSQFFCAFSRNLICANGMINFGHKYIRSAVKTRYIKGDEEWSLSCSRKIIKELKKNEEQNQHRAWNELPFQYVCTNDMKSLYDLIINPDAFLYYYDCQTVMLSRIWRMLSTQYSYKAYLELLVETDEEYKYQQLLKMSHFFRLWIADTEFSIKCAKEAYKCDISKEQRAEIDNSIGLTLISSGQYKKGLEHLYKSYHSRAQIFGKCHKKTIESLNNLAETNRLRENFTKAIAQLTSVIDYAEKAHDYDPIALSTHYNNIGTCYCEIGKFENGLSFLEKALALRCTLLGESHTLTAQAYNNIAMLYDDMGNRQKALDCQKKSVMIYKEIFGEEHPDTIVTCENLNFLYQKYNMEAYELK